MVGQEFTGVDQDMNEENVPFSTNNINIDREKVGGVFGNVDTKISDIW